MSIDLSKVRVFGPLAVFAAGFAGELTRQRYTPVSARLLLELMAHLSRWLESKGRAVGDLCPEEVERFLRARRAAGYANHRTGKALQPLLGYLRGLGVAPPLPLSSPEGPVEGALERYRTYLTIERGLKEETARGYVNAARPFLRGRASPDGTTLDLGQLRAADVIAFVVARCPHQRHGTARMTVTSLRSLLNFLHVEGIIERSLASAVPSVSSRRLAGLPKGLDPDQIRRLLSSCDSDSQNGCRDLAVLILLVRLGLRAGEVAALRLDDIDWHVGEIVVPGKGRCTERLPLPIDTGEALAAYLCRGRPADAQGRTVFVRIKAPHRALTACGVTQIVAAAALRAGLGQIYAHRLRHSAATQMLHAGASLPEIGQVLRHRRALSTAIYAKVDRKALRRIARPWIGGVA